MVFKIAQILFFKRTRLIKPSVIITQWACCMAIACLLIMITALALAEPAGPDEGWAPIVQKLETRLDDMENRLDDLQQRLIQLESQSSAITASSSSNSDQSPDQSKSSLPEKRLTRQRWQESPPGWHITLLKPVQANNSYDDTLLGQFISERDTLALSEGQASLKQGLISPVRYQRRGILWVDQAGWHRLGLELLFPPRGYAGFLGGFYCQVSIILDKREIVNRRLRMPYGEQGRIKRAVNSRRLEPGLHFIEQQIQCMPDGRQAADPMPAWRAISARSLLARPGSRKALPPREGVIRQPAAHMWPIDDRRP